MCFLPGEECNTGNMANVSEPGQINITSKFIAFTILGSTLSTWVMFSNIMIMLVTFKNARLKTRTGYFIASLALADFLNGLFNFTSGYTKSFAPAVGNKPLCGLYVFMQVFPFVASIASLTCMALDRYLAVCHPLKSSTLLSKSRSVYVIIISWTASFLITLPVFFWNKHYENEGCTLRHMENYYFLLVFQIVFWVCLLLKIIMYTRVVITLRHNLTKFKRLQERRLSESAGNDMHFDKRQLSNEIRVTILVCLVLIIFLVCWLPMIFIYNVYFTTGRDRLKTLAGSISFLAFIHSGLNFFLYLVSPEYRRSFRNTLCKCCKKKPTGHLVSSTSKSEGTNESAV